MMGLAAIFYGVLRAAFSKEVMFEQRPGRQERMS